jgi:hypothetical protein
MVKVYAVALALGVLALLGWIGARALAVNVPSWTNADPEKRLGVAGRSVVSGLVGFGLAGMSAEFSPRDLSWPIALGLAVLGGAAAVWYAGWVDRRNRAGDG